MDKLKQYQGKRDFSKTPEPRGVQASGDADPVFVLQQHDARSLHFDFRLEHDGVLLSWAVPKGPSTDPREKRLAVRTEDHPLEYARFEGRIPEGEYGAGVVIVWDYGSYENVSDRDGDPISMEEALAKGHIRARLHGQKLSGVYSLLHTKMRGDEKNWLLVKEDDDGADARRNPVSTEPESIISGRDIESMAKAVPSEPTSEEHGA